MKWPWRKLEDRTAKAIVNLKTLMESKIGTAISTEHVMIMEQISILKRSEQIKYTRLEQRLNDLEGCCKGPLVKYRKGLEDQEKMAAREIDKQP